MSILLSMDRTWHEIQMSTDPSGSPWLNDARWQEGLRSVLAQCDEKVRRQVVGLLSLCLKHGGQKKLASVSGLCEPTIAAGRNEVVGGAEPCEAGRVRRPGAGRKRKEEKDPGIEKALLEIVEEHKAGDPQRLDVWAGRSLVRLQAELAKRGHGASKNTLRRLLKKTGSPSLETASVSRVRRTPIGIRNSSI
jgi:hypothetical protein